MIWGRSVCQVGVDQGYWTHRTLPNFYLGSFYPNNTISFQKLPGTQLKLLTVNMMWGRSVCRVGAGWGYWTHRTLSWAQRWIVWRTWRRCLKGEPIRFHVIDHLFWHSRQFERVLKISNKTLITEYWYFNLVQPDETDQFWLATTLTFTLRADSTLRTRFLKLHLNGSTVPPFLLHFKHT